MKPFQKLLIASVSAIFVVPVLAQDTLKITVTGTRAPKPVDSFPGSIEVIDQEELSIKSGSSIKELTDDIPGVTVRNTKRSGVRGPSGTGNVNIRGLDFQRILSWALIFQGRLVQYLSGILLDSFLLMHDTSIVFLQLRC